MSNRSAEASIKGYNYQFLHTIKDILENESDTFTNTVEGIEDLDIVKDNEKSLIQYKYHEEQSYTNSKVAKPIALMFKHFQENEEELVNYKLFIFLNEDDLPELTNDIILQVLKIKEARKILSETEIELSLDMIDSLTSQIDKFVPKLEWKLTEKYDDLENSIIYNFTKDLAISNEESKFIYLSNAVKIINDLAIQGDEENRSITKREFILQLHSSKDVLYSSFLLRDKGFIKFKKVLFHQKRILNVKKNSSSYFVQINNIDRENINGLIIDLVKKFIFKGNKIDIRAISFVVNCEREKYSTFKKTLHTYMASLNDSIIMNDGVEDYEFNVEHFNSSPLRSKNRAGNQFNRVSFNFRFIHQSIYSDYKDNISLSNPSLFIVDTIDSTLDDLSEKKFYLNNLNNQQLLEIIGD